MHSIVWGEIYLQAELGCKVEAISVLSMGFGRAKRGGSVAWLCSGRCFPPCCT